MFSPTPTEECFGIIYLMFDDVASVSWQYGLCFPTLEVVDASYDASWSGSMWN
jgi:hypothetical protein